METLSAGFARAIAAICRTGGADSGVTTLPQQATATPVIVPNTRQWTAVLKSSCRTMIADTAAQDG